MRVKHVSKECGKEAVQLHCGLGGRGEDCGSGKRENQDHVSSA